MRSVQILMSPSKECKPSPALEIFTSPLSIDGVKSNPIISMLIFVRGIILPVPQQSSKTEPSISLHNFK